MRLPFETVRRKSQKLIVDGLCIATPHGLYVPAEVIGSAWHTQIQRERAQQLLALYRDLRLAGCLDPAAQPELGLHAGVRRQVNRRLSFFILRTSDRLSRFAGGVVDAAVFAGLLDLTTHGPDIDATGSAETPRSARAVAAHMAMSRETVRRRLAALETRDLVVRADEGFACAVPAAKAAEFRAFTASNLQQLRRLFSDLATLAQIELRPDPH